MHSTPTSLKDWSVHVVSEAFELIHECKTLQTRTSTSGEQACELVMELLDVAGWLEVAVQQCLLRRPEVLVAMHRWRDKNAKRGLKPCSHTIAWIERLVRYPEAWLPNVFPQNTNLGISSRRNVFKPASLPSPAELTRLEEIFLGWVREDPSWVLRNSTSKWLTPDRECDKPDPFDPT